MNVSDLARRLKVTPNELLEKLPALGFDIGKRAIKIDDVLADKIFKKWVDEERRERLRKTLVGNAQRGQTQNSSPVQLKEVVLPSVIVVRDLAGKLNLPVTKVIQELMKAGILASQNERLDFETAAIISEELGFKATVEETKSEDSVELVQAMDRVKEIMESEVTDKLEPRPPVIVVMGHVDHGKTRLLDAIRNTHVVDKEAGGITQHIGAYQVERHDRKMTFIDTPGHEAFTVMRSRGAKVADIAILVVAADDGVQPQTKEAYNIINAAKLPFVVALNKIDKPEADPDRVLAQLAELGITTEAWGGNVPLAKVSAKAMTGIDELLDVLLLVADLNTEKVRANPNRLAAGTIIESHLNKGEGPVATVLIQTGSLHRNEHLGIAGAAYGRVRAMRDWTGKQVDEATPGMPVKVLGFKVLPAVGDIFEVPEDPRTLEVKKVKTVHQVASQLSATRTVGTEDSNNTNRKVLNVVLKCDTLGSLEALLGMIEKLQHEDVGVTVIQKGLGNVNENEITRAETAKPSVVYAFNVIPTHQASVLARDKNVDIKQFKIIYELFDDIVARLNVLVPPEVIVTHLGQFETVAIFRTEHARMVVGGKVTEGKILPGEKVRVWRRASPSAEEEPIGEGVIDSLQSGKSTTKEVHAGQECGISFKGKTKIQIGDRLEVYHEEIKARKFEIPR
ncbi:translation initiation factor IF-2 [Candidatus Uhrbacteria bacterium]|nr:translation initiation factor IF-2 [Candidatus Uhrbacteria bacterium]